MTPDSAPLPSVARREWRATGLALLLVGAAILLLYGTSFTSMVAIWARSETFTHGFVVPLISAWLVWRARQRIAPLAPEPAPAWTLALLPVGLLWLLGELASANALVQLAAVLTLILAFLALLGPRLAWRLAFPLAFLLFAVPVGEFAMPRLMDWTADFAVAGLRFTGVPVYREGLSFVIPSGHWSVVEACSGVRYLLASTMVGTLFAYLNFRAPWRRLAFMALSVVVPIVANWARAYMIVMLGHLSGNRLAVGVDHLVYGWVFFGLVILLLFWIGARWAERAEPDGALPEAPETPWVPRFSSRRLGAVIALLIAFAALPPAFMAWVEHSEARAAEVPPPDFARIPWGAWQAASAPTAFVPAYQKASATGRVHLTRDGAGVDVFVAYYRQQTPERKLITSTNTVVRADDPQWTVIATSRQAVPLAGRVLELPVLQLAPKAAAVGTDARRRTIWRWYWVDGALCTSEVEARLRTVWSRLLGRGDAAAVIVISSESAGGAAPATVLERFAAEAAPALHALLDGEGAPR
ncbi:MAG: exosortase A [Azonexus sp.]|nr:exosortase A [Betaproteobacteria bacterium]MBK8918990.1 exosortase A [Betaproteobacteria bacterium]MBP6035805.1 exosortase A [Azonexus sp.]MBP6905442.1 exosortase A [Azonexus sp.]